ncbi:MAG: cell division protein ZipA C-terminal FtsZ-binding domain-containing protein, partial [Woeseiaceae bacterium]
MDGLRWLLLLFGLLVIAGVYFHSRRDKAESEDADDGVPARVEPKLEDVDVEPVDDEADDPVDTPGQDVPQKIVTLRLIGRNKKPFPGDDLILSMRGIGLRHGKFGIFHRYDGNDESRTIFSAASLVEPGSFDLANIKDQQIPGISLFL